MFVLSEWYCYCANDSPKESLRDFLLCWVIFLILSWTREANWSQASLQTKTIILHLSEAQGIYKTRSPKVAFTENPKGRPYPISLGETATSLAARTKSLNSAPSVVCPVSPKCFW